MTRVLVNTVALMACALVLVACAPEPDASVPGVDPDSAPRVAVDRFSDEAATLLRRSSMAGLPGPDEPIDFDARFLIDGLGPQGEPISYYNIDVQLGRAMRVHRVVDGRGDAIPDQLPIVTAVPGNAGYSDFWQFVDHEAPDGYVANSITDADALLDQHWPQALRFDGRNRPLVPEGSTAERRVTSDDVTDARAWFSDEVVSFLAFDEAPVQLRGDFFPYSIIYVCFEIPPAADGTPQSGFCAEDDGRTHNVLETLPGDLLYSPLWDVRVYAPESFPAVVDLDTAVTAPVVADLPMVNCPIARAP